MEANNVIKRVRNEQAQLKHTIYTLTKRYVKKMHITIKKDRIQICWIQDIVQQERCNTCITPT